MASRAVKAFEKFLREEKDMGATPRRLQHFLDSAAMIGSSAADLIGAGKYREAYELLNGKAEDKGGVPAARNIMENKGPGGTGR